MRSTTPIEDIMLFSMTSLCLIRSGVVLSDTVISEMPSDIPQTKMISTLFSFKRWLFSDKNSIFIDRLTKQPRYYAMDF